MVRLLIGTCRNDLCILLNYCLLGPHVFLDSRQSLLTKDQSLDHVGVRNHIFPLPIQSGFQAPSAQNLSTPKSLVLSEDSRSNQQSRMVSDIAVRKVVQRRRIPRKLRPIYPCHSSAPSRRSCKMKIRRSEFCQDHERDIKSVKTESSQSIHRQHPQAIGGANYNPLTAPQLEFRDPSVGVMKIYGSDSDKNHQNLIEIVGDPVVERPILESTHPFACLRDGLVQYGMEIYTAEMENNINTTEVEYAFSSVGGEFGDDEWIKVTTDTSFACPFYSNDPKGHRGCLQTTRLNGILSVKRHVCQDHRIPAYCPICYEVFGSAQSKDRHIRERKCEQRENIRVEGVTDDQVKLVAKISNQLSDREQWFAVFRTILPGEALPNSPYLSGDLEDIVARMWAFWRLEGKRIVSDFVSRHVPEFNHSQFYGAIPDEERMLVALHDAALSDMLGIVMEKYKRYNIAI